MSIQKITKKEYDKINALREQSEHARNRGELVFECADGKYYKCNQSGMAGVKEMTAYKELIAIQVRENEERTQLKLFQSEL